MLVAEGIKARADLYDKIVEQSEVIRNAQEEFPKLVEEDGPTTRRKRRSRSSMNGCFDRPVRTGGFSGFSAGHNASTARQFGGMASAAQACQALFTNAVTAKSAVATRTVAGPAAWM